MRFYNFLCDGLPHLLLDLFLQISYILMLLSHLVKNSFSVFADSDIFLKEYAVCMYLLFVMLNGIGKVM